MKAAVFRTVHQPLTIEDVDISAPGPHEVCVRTAAAGVCHSDVHFQQGLYPCPTPIVLAAIIYFLLLWPMVRLLSRLENRALASRR